METMSFPKIEKCKRLKSCVFGRKTKIKIEKLCFWVEKMRGRTESTNFDTLVSNFDTRRAEMP